MKLWKLEKEASRITLAYCNGEIGNDGEDVNGYIVGVDKPLKAIENQAQALFDNKLMGFFINRDPRGYALKIKSEVTAKEYAEVGLHRDWGGYGILSPTIE